MRFENRSVRLKDGRECVLRPTTAEYAQEMIDYMKITAAETPFLLRYPDEVKYTLENEKEILARIYGDEKTVMMLALVDGQVAGNCSISGLGDKRVLGTGNRNCYAGLPDRIGTWDRIRADRT